MTIKKQAFYTLAKSERAVLIEKINGEIYKGIEKNDPAKLILFFSDDDTYIRKAAYQAVGKIYQLHKPLQKNVLALLEQLLLSKECKVRQTTVNAAGEIGMKVFTVVEHFFDAGLLDEHHVVRNAVIGSIKKMGGKNPEPVLKWARKYLRHEDKEIRREICHGIELRGRTHPQDVLPLLQELEYDKTSRVRNTLIHVLGQISYKQGCLKTVVSHLKYWSNQELVAAAITEIIDVHERYKDFAVLTQKQAKAYINKTYYKRSKE